MRPGTFLSYSTSVLFLLVLASLVYAAFQVLTAAWLIALGISVLIPTLGAWSAFLWIKVRATYMVDIQGVKAAAPRKRIAQRKRD